MKNLYEVYELRGCGIEYSVYQGSMQECIDFVAAEEAAQKDDYEYENYFNGNRQPFSWEIREY